MVILSGDMEFWEFVGVFWWWAFDFFFLFHWLVLVDFFFFLQGWEGEGAEFNFRFF